MFRPTKPEDWEPYRAMIAHLYNTMKLKDVMTEMEVQYSFKATEKQYKTQLKKWNLDTKYTRSGEYTAMIAIQRRRERENKQTRFSLRGRPVDPRDITRFEKRAQKKGLLKDNEDPTYTEEDVEDLYYDTPPPEDEDYLFPSTDASASTSVSLPAHYHSQYQTTYQTGYDYQSTQYHY